MYFVAVPNNQNCWNQQTHNIREMYNNREYGDWCEIEIN